MQDSAATIVAETLLDMTPLGVVRSFLELLTGTDLRTG